MIIKKIDSGWLVSDIQSVMSPNVKGRKIKIEMVFDDIIKSKILNIYYSSSNPADLVIVRKKCITTDGINKTIKETIVLQDYETLKSEPMFQNLKKEIDLFFNNKLIHKLPQIAKKTLVFSVAGVVLIGGYKLVREHKIQKIRQTSSIESMQREDDLDYSLVLDLFNKYCNLFQIDDIQRNDIYSIILPDIKSSSNIEQTIMNKLYEYYMENLYGQIPASINDKTEKEMESYIIRSSNILEINDEEILYTMLAVHKLETLNGTSEDCINKNNLGNNTINIDGNIKVEEFPNVEVGSIKFVLDFMQKYNETYNPDNSIEYNMYHNDKGEEYIDAIKSIKIMLKEDNELDNINELLKKEGKIY